MMKSSQRRLIAGYLLLTACVAGLHAIDFMLLKYSTLAADMVLWGKLIVFFGTFVAVGFVALTVFYMPAVGSVLILIGLILAAARGGIMLTYLTYNLDRHLPLWDDALAHADHLLGFHWPSMLAWFDQRPALAKVTFHLYNLFLPQKIVIPLILILAGQYERAQTIFLAALTGLVATHAFAYFMPAVGSYPYYGLQPSDHPNISLVLAGICEPEVAALRSGELVAISHRVLYGLIACPSYHAAMSVMFTWALWRIPYVRWIAVIINAGMLLATPLHGSHYLSETLAGVPLGIASICIASATIALAYRLASRRATALSAASSSATQILLWIPARRQARFASG